MQNYKLIWHPQDTDSAATIPDDIPIAFPVIFLAVLVVSTIQLNNQLRFGAIEVCDISVNGVEPFLFDTLP